MATSYKNLILYTSLCLTLTLILKLLKIPIFFLHGLFTYIHPDAVDNSKGIKAAIRRPDSDSSSFELKKRGKSKEKYEFDENNAQIFRLKLDEGHLETRIYFKEYCDAFRLSLVGVLCLLLKIFLSVSEDSGVLGNEVLVPVLLGVVGVGKVFVILAKVSFEKSASKRSEKQLSVGMGFLGFLLGFIICCELAPSVFDVKFGSIDGFGRISVALLMGCFSGFLFMPATKCARAFWIGTDQLRWNLSIISCGWIARVILYVNYLLIVFTALLWIKPMTAVLVNVNNSDTKEAIGNADKLVENLGISQSDFEKLRVWCLLLSGILQVVALRPNLQMYLNEAVLSWYQRLHSSKVPDLDFSRAKVFLHNHYLCLVVLQFFAPPALVLLFLGLSQVESNLFENFQFISSLLPYSASFKEVALLMAWWVVFVWAIFTSASLLLYRRGILYVS